jgi:dynein heavy chain
MNMSKFVHADKSLFTELIQDIFPNVAALITANPHLKESAAIRKKLKERNLVDKPDFFLKCIQLYETSTVRHGFMVVGQAGCGKTTIFNVLTESLTEIPGNPKYDIKRMNPKAITNAEMYGTMNSVGEWEEGVFSVIWKDKNNKKNKNINWICCDGPVDAIWIENLNTVLDDNQILTLANAERIPMNDNTKMTFEVENLDNASPATVSRCGQIYVSPTDLFWEPLFETWAGDRADRNEANMTSCSPDEGTWVKNMVQKYFRKPNFFNYSLKNLQQKMRVPEVI